MNVQSESKEMSNQNTQADLDDLEIEIKSFILRCREDGVMTVADLRKLAFSIGVQDPNLINQEVELIREIQKVCRHRPCFQSGRRELCEEVDCEWISECRKLIAVWKRYLMKFRGHNT